MKKTKKRKNRVLTPEQKQEQAKKRKEAAFRRKIRGSFIDAGFIYFPTVGIHFRIGNRVVELDYVFMYENIIIICEDNCKEQKDKDHIRTKNESFSEIKNNSQTFIDWLANTFPEHSDAVKKYRVDRILLYYIYISQNDIDLTEDDRNRFSNLHFWDSDTLSFFSRMSQCIQYSAKYEIFRYLGIKDDEIGFSRSEEGKTVIKAPIICPQDAMGLRNGIRVVSFMMSAEKLMRTSYVLRKDSWQESMFLYQRLIEKEKVKSIRKFLADKGAAFYNNIIVALPDSVKFEDDSNDHKLLPINEVADFQHCKLVIPDEMNSICVIDGQHRIFAHHEAPATEKYESRISILRKQLHLLVTGLIFPPEMTPSQRMQIQSEIFLDINDNTKKVAANVLTHIEMIKDPFSDVGLARRVIEKLNRSRVFLNRFELSGLDEGKIKVASIIKFALRYLVTVNPAEGKTSLYSFWDGDKEAFMNKEEAALSDYIDFCSAKIDLYFSAVKEVFKETWHDPSSKIKSVISLNGFIIAFNRQLGKNGIRDFQFYSDSLKKLTVSFSKDEFPYTSSRYRLFSSRILEECFGFSQDEINNT